MWGLAACCKWMEQQCVVMWIDNLITTVLDWAGLSRKKKKPLQRSVSLVLFYFSFTLSRNANLTAWQTSSKHYWSHFSCGLTHWYAWWWMIIHNGFHWVWLIKGSCFCMLCSLSLYCHVLINFFEIHWWQLTTIFKPVPLINVWLFHLWFKSHGLIWDVFNLFLDNNLKKTLKATQESSTCHHQPFSAWDGLNLSHVL